MYAKNLILQLLRSLSLTTPPPGLELFGPLIKLLHIQPVQLAVGLRRRARRIDCLYMPQPVLILVQHHAHPSSFGSGKHPTQKRRCEACTLWIAYHHLVSNSRDLAILFGRS
jgi:hypothetical protein